MIITNSPKVKIRDDAETFYAGMTGRLCFRSPEDSKDPDEYIWGFAPDQYPNTVCYEIAWEEFELL